jgi:hypothetical protein
VIENRRIPIGIIMQAYAFLPYNNPIEENWPTCTENVRFGLDRENITINSA